MTVAALQDRLLAALAPRLARRRVALLDVPNHTNCGDSAILLGTERLLRRLGARVVHRSDHVSFRPAAIRALPADVVLCLNGGGNLGDLWPRFQALRERVVAAFPDREIVQLPQSIGFRDARRAERLRALIAAHPRFHLLVRDAASVERARALLGCEAALVPDLAFMLGPLPRPAPPARDVVALCRTDREARAPLGPAAAAAGVEVVDWLHPTDAVAHPLRRTHERLARRAHRLNRVPPPRLAGALTRLAYVPLARMRLGYGLGLVSRGRAVVTDRLHAHVMCALLGIPSVAVDTGYGKVRGVHERWMADAPRNRLADSLDDALALAAALAADARGRPVGRPRRARPAVSPGPT